MKIKCFFPAGTLQYAIENITDNYGNWENRVLNVSPLYRSIGENKSFEVSGVSIELNDFDRFFRTMMSGENRYIAGKTVELLTIDDQMIYTGTVEKWEFREDSFHLSINDRLSGLETLIPETISKNTYGNCANEANGKSIPLIYGQVKADEGAVKCWRVNTNTFLLAGHHCKELVNNTAYQDDGTPITGASLDNNADGKAYVQCTYTGDFIYVNVKGKMDAGSNLIEDPIEAIKDIIDNYTDMDYDQYGMDEAQAIMADRNYKIAAVIDNQETLIEILVNFCFSFDCDFYIGKGNKIIISLLKWSTLTPQKSFLEKQISEFYIEENPDQIINKIRYMYGYNYAKQYFERTPFFQQDDSVQNWGSFYAKNNPLDLRYVSNDQAAFDVVQRFIIQRKNPLRIAKLTLPLCEYMGLDISDIIEITHPAAINPKPRKYQIRRFSVNFADETVSIEAVDITYLTGSALVLGDSTILAQNWELADENDRNYAYLADRETGLFNSSDHGKILY
jgi:hypothetical protein